MRINKSKTEAIGVDSGDAVVSEDSSDFSHRRNESPADDAASPFHCRQRIPLLPLRAQSPGASTATTHREYQLPPSRAYGLSLNLNKRGSEHAKGGMLRLEQRDAVGFPESGRLD